MVLIATPGMLHGGLSLAVFKEWCEDSRNTIIIPGYCVPGTVGHSLLKGADLVHIDGKEYEVRCEIQTISFSAHSDHRGIMQVMRWVHPDNVVLVHGEEERMRGLASEVQNVLGLPCYYPANYERLVIPCNVLTTLNIEYPLLNSYKQQFHQNFLGEVFGQNQAEEVVGNVYQDWIQETTVLFGCELNTTLEGLQEKVPEDVLEHMKIEEKSKNKLMITWESDKDSLISSYIGCFPEP